MNTPSDESRAATRGARPEIAGTLVERMHIDVHEVTDEGVTGTMPVEGNTQPYGLLHGGASAVLAETLGSYLAAHLAGPGRAAVGVDLSCTHHRAARRGTVTGRAVPLHAGRSLVTSEIVVTDEDDRRVCTARLTCLLRDAPPGA